MAFHGPEFSPGNRAEGTLLAQEIEQG